MTNNPKILEILHYPDKRLYLKAKPINVVDDTIKQLAVDLAATMYEHNGLGLAATQVNVQLRMFVMDLARDGEARNLITCINPEIKIKKGEIVGQEGCLSVPGIYDDVLRAEEITLEYLDINGKQQQLECNGLMAVCVQHEIDHLDGKVFVDYLSQLKQNFIKKKMKKITKNA